nr:uncharacterized protein LOC128688110 [Cherax quadricarinatus]
MLRMREMDVQQVGDAGIRQVGDVGEQRVTYWTVVSDTWSEFWTSTAISGISNAGRANDRLPRVLWLLLFGVGTYYTVRDTIGVIDNYLSYPYTTQMDLQHMSTVQFPAVTVCNQNRLSCQKLFNKMLEVLSNTSVNSYVSGSGSHLNTSSDGYTLLVLYNISSCGVETIGCPAVQMAYYSNNFTSGKSIPVDLRQMDYCLYCSAILQSYRDTCKSSSTQYLENLWNNLSCCNIPPQPLGTCPGPGPCPGPSPCPGLGPCPGARPASGQGVPPASGQAVPPASGPGVPASFGPSVPTAFDLLAPAAAGTAASVGNGLITEAVLGPVTAGDSAAATVVTSGPAPVVPSGSLTTAVSGSVIPAASSVVTLPISGLIPAATSGLVTAAAPGSVTAVAPGPVTAAAPGPVTVAAPGPVTAASPDPVTGAAPDSVTAVAPGPVTAAAPDSVTAVAPGPVTAAAPGPVTAAALGPVTAAAPDPVTAAAPGPATAAAPGPATAAAPSSVTAATPDPVTAAAAGSVTEGASGPAIPATSGAAGVPVSDPLTAGVPVSDPLTAGVLDPVSNNKSTDYSGSNGRVLNGSLKPIDCTVILSSFLQIVRRKRQIGPEPLSGPNMQGLPTSQWQPDGFGGAGGPPSPPNLSGPPQGPPNAKPGRVMAPSEMYNMQIKFLSAYMNLTQELQEAIGYSLTELILACDFLGYNCSDNGNFKTVFSPMYGNCYTFNSDGHWNTSLTGPMYSLSLLINVNQTTYLPHLMTGKAGTRVVIHVPGTQPLLDTEAFDVAPGTATSIAIKQVTLVRLQSPYKSNCTNNWNETLYTYSNSSIYSLTECLSICLQRFFVDNCNCSHPLYPQNFKFLNKLYLGIPSCNLTKQENISTCIDTKLAEYAKNPDSAGCGCNVECSEIQYFKSESTAAWPPLSSKREVESKYSKHADENLLQLFIFFNTLNFDTVNQTAVYNDLTDLVSALGGALSLYLGLSVFLIAEVVEWFLYLIYNSFMYARGRYNPHESYSANNKVCRPMPEPPPLSGKAAADLHYVNSIYGTFQAD